MRILAALLLLFAASIVSLANSPSVPMGPEPEASPPAPEKQSQADADKKSAGCVTCHTASDRHTMHANPAVVLGCTDCHGGNATIEKITGSEYDSKDEKAHRDYLSAMSKAHVLPRYPDLTWPSDMYLEGSDQHRGWFQSSLWTSVIAHGAVPYQAVLTHGFIVDHERNKISKSSTYEKPQTSDAYVADYGADVLRLWIASQDFRDDIPISKEILGHVGETYRLIRNTFRYQLSNLFDFDYLLKRAHHLGLHAFKYFGRNPRVPVMNNADSEKNNKKGKHK